MKFERMIIFIGVGFISLVLLIGLALDFTMAHAYFTIRAILYTACSAALGLYVLGIAKKAKALQQELEKEQKKAKALQQELEKAREGQLSGIIPTCSNCKKVRRKDNTWQQMELYIQEHSDGIFSHGVCPECMEELYPGLCSEHTSPEAENTTGDGP